MPDKSNNQINLSYNEEQDRILLKITNLGKEYRLWFTRRLALRLNNLFIQQNFPSDHAASHLEPAQKQTLGSFEKQAAIQTADFGTPFAAEKTTEYPLGEDGVLVQKVDVNVKGKVVHMSMHPKEGQGATLSLPPNQRYSFEHIFQQVIGKAEWLNSETEATAESSELSH